MDVILFWNEVALEANRISHTTGQDSATLGPVGSSRALAIIHLAMYDAYAKVTNALPVYDASSTSPSAPTNATAQGAATGAAHQALVCLYPSLKEMLERWRKCAPGAADTIGLVFGKDMANHVLSTRAADPDASAMGYVPSNNRGRHRQDPDNSTQGFHGPKYGCSSKTFAVTNWHELDEPPAPNSTKYLRALRQVRGLGIAPELAGTLPANIPYRTPDQHVAGIYWGYDGAANLGTPPRLYNQIVRQVAMEKNNSELENAKLFALVNVAMGDAGILAWAEKYKHDLWRPVVGIREHDINLGPDANGGVSINNDTDTNWLPLGAPKSNSVGAKNFTPPFPAYPSGHATFGAAALQITRLFYNEGAEGQDTLFPNEFVSDEYNGKTVDNKGTVRPNHPRKFADGLWDMIIENGFSRVYVGVHWSFDSFALVGNTNTPDLTQNIGGVPLGLNIANDIFTNSTNAGWKTSLNCPFPCPVSPPPHA